MPTDIRAFALNAVAETGGKIAATKLVRDRVDCGLREAVEAVDWALEHPGAEALPERSIVATNDSIYTKVALDEPTLPWRELTDGKHLNYASDADVTDLIRSGEARVLRVGGEQ